MSRLRPTAGTALRLAEALGEALAGRSPALSPGFSIDRIWRPSERVLLVRFAGLRPHRLLVDLDDRRPRVVLTEVWPETPERPDQTTLRLRDALEGARLRAVRFADERRLDLDFGTAILRIQLAGRYLNAAAFDPQGEEIAKLLRGRPAIDPESPPLRPGPPEAPELAGQAWLEAIDRTWREEAEALAAEDRRLEVVREARSLGKKLRRTLEALDRDLERAREAEADRHRGELLKTVLGRVPRGAGHVDVPDWEDPAGGTTRVPLDPSLDARANMERYFKGYRRLHDAKGRIEARRAEAAGRLARLEEVERDLDAPSPDLGAASRELRALGHRPKPAPAPARRGKEPARRPYASFRTADGSEVLVGRGDRDNDALTFRVARGRDLWLHARDVPGSHVVLRAAGPSGPDHEALLDAALLAAWHSKARGEAIVDVTWTERKHVRRIPGAPPGLVSVSEARTLAVRHDPARLARLYDTREGPGGGGGTDGGGS